MPFESPSDRPAIAVVGISGRFPGARSIAELWDNLCARREAVQRFRADELEDDFDETTRQHQDFVAARSILPDIDQFDAGFFAMTPRDAALTDPQQRVFLECCWEALEAAGCDAPAYPGAIGVYAGSSFNTYLLRHVCGDRTRIGQFTSDFQAGSYPELVGALPDFLATRVAYKLDLKGPAVNVASACSTSLLAVTQACQGLLNYQCDLALAGGVSITLPQKRGYLATEGGMLSRSGQCRPFDARADGTVFGSGAGVVAMKRLEDAVADGDYIWGVICGFGVNNDGAAKVGFAAPSVQGQADAIQQAHAMAGITADAIGYIEAHGTGTPLGDPIEFAALLQAFQATSDKVGHCVIGSAKANLGHLDAAAGVIGLIKTLLAIDREMLPGLLHFEKPNPHLPLVGSPFAFSAETQQWPAGDEPRYAGVSSFGVGGTNVHVVVAEAPVRSPMARQPRPVILPISARSPAALSSLQSSLAATLQGAKGFDLADVAWTLQTGRRAFASRSACVAYDMAEAHAALMTSGASRQAHPRLEIGFLFPGQGAQHAGMARDLHASEPVFRDAFDRCADILGPVLSAPLANLLNQSCPHVNETWFSQPAVFSVSYALASLWQSWGVTPTVMVGHSVGEFVAACRAGVFDLEDALRLVADRGRLMQDMPRGSMLSVRLSADALVGRLGPELSIAAVNGPQLSVAAGPTPLIEDLARSLEADGVPCRILATSHAFHSAMMEPAVRPFLDLVGSVRLSPPRIPIISTLTGEPLSDEQATDPLYWARHLREAVLYSPAVSRLRQCEGLALVEVGPGAALSTLARQHEGSREQLIVSSLPASGSGAAELPNILKAAAKLWEAGCNLNWAAMTPGDKPRRLPLPTYPFERQRHWIERPMPTAADLAASRQSDITTLPASNPGLPVMSTAAAMLNTKPQSSELRAAISSRLIEIFKRISGQDLSASDPNSSFLDLGFDSLLLTQAARAIQTGLGVKIAFRQLMGDEGSLAALVSFIETRGPKIDLPAPTPVSTTAPQAPQVAPVAGPGGTMAESQQGQASTGIEQLMREQLQLVSQVVAGQMEALKSLRRSESVPVITQAPAPLAQPQSTATVASAPATTPATAQATSTASTSFGPFKGLQARATGELTAKQKSHLAALIERIANRAPKSKAQTQAHRRHLADPRVVSGFRDIWKEMIFPVVVNRSKGSRLWDIDGNEYIDLLNGFGPIMFGHRPDFVETAVAQQLADGLEIGPQTPLAGEIAEMFCKLTGNERMTFCNTGSEAVMAAFRIARTVTGRDKVVMFSGDYHGMFDEVLVTAKGGRPEALPIAPGIPRDSVANVKVLDYGTPEALDWIRANAADIAAVIVEPVQSRRPDFRPVAFLKELRVVTAAAGTALIFDEIVTGFRVHPGGCQELFGIRADMATYGKVLGGGMPIGVLAGKAEFMDALDGGAWRYGDTSVPEVGVTFFAGTFVRHPLTLAAVRAVLKEMIVRGPSLQDELNARTTALVARLNAVFEAYGLPTRISHFGSIMFFRFPADERMAGLFYYMLREQGIHALEGFPCFLTTTHTDADLDKVVSAFERAARQMREADFIAAPAPAGLPAADVEPLRCPLTEAQREVFLAAMLDPEASTAFNESLALDLRGPLEPKALQQSMAQVLDRHEALRAHVDRDGDHLVITSALDVAIREHDLTSHDELARSQAYQSILAEEARTPFDLHTAPLVRARLVKLGKEHHALVFTAHHIVCDGWSTNVILEELGQFYSAAVEGTSPALAEAASFSAYATDRAHESNWDTQRYWLDQFADKPDPLDLPTDRPRGASRTFAGTTARYQFSATLGKTCRQFAAGEKSSLFMVLLAGFNALLARLSTSSSIVVGVPMAAQAHLDGGSLVGHCVDFLPLRTRIAPSDTFRTLLQKIRTTILEAADHQSYTYGTLVSALHMARNPTRLPLTEIHFNLEQVGAGIRFGQLTAAAEPNAKTAVNPDIFLNLVESEKGLVAYCDYNTDLYAAATIADWMTQLEDLVTEAVRKPDEPLTDLLLVEPGHATSDLRPIATWNNTTTAYPQTSLATLIEAQAAKTPDRIAVSQGLLAISYGDLNARANWYAHRLHEVGATKGALVGICVSRSPEMLAALLGILKSGAAYVPLDPTHPKDRLRFILEDANISVVIVETDFRGLFDGTPARQIELDAASSGQSRLINPNNSVEPSDAAYVMFTSGTTGRPKGVAVHHGALVNLLTYCVDQLECRHDDVVAAIATIGFDISCIELYLPLLVGAQIEIVSSAVTIDGNQLGRLIAERKVTLFQATPATWQLLLNAGWQGAPGMRAISTGEPLPRDVALAVLPRIAKLWNGYGPTETTVWSTIEHVANVDEPITIGRPIANTQIHILSEGGQELGVGDVGELWIGGDGVAKGYLNRPELTAERFVEKDGRRLYRTGDLARWLPDGRLMHLGRIDHQVKIRGFRIELGEIESVLREFPGVRQAIVVADKSEGTGRLVAFCTTATGTDINRATLQLHLAAKLPDYMVPVSIIMLDTIPVSPNGKVDRNRLLDIERERRELRVIVDPETDDEKKLVDIVVATMNLDRVGVTDNLFELGIDSLRMFQIASRANRENLGVTPRMLMLGRTIRAALAEAAKSPRSSAIKMIEIKPIPRDRMRRTSN